MKTFAILAAARLALGVAIPNHSETALVYCHDPPAKTVTVTAPGGNGGYGAEAKETVTVTVTKEAGGAPSPPPGGNPPAYDSQPPKGGDNQQPPPPPAQQLPPNNRGGYEQAPSPAGQNPPPPPPPPQPTYTTGPGGQKVWQVQVGAFDQGEGLPKLFEFRPNNLTGVAKGDKIKFQMLAAAHSVTQSTLDKPCVNAQRFNTDLVNNTANALNLFKEFTVNDISKPLWFYCKQKNANHCGKGMVFGVNPKDDDQMRTFIDTAIAQNGSVPDVPGAPGKVHIVKVGAFSRGDAPPAFEFRPNNVVAKKGDVVRFQMLSARHSVTQSAFAKPCVKTGPFDTELVNNTANALNIFRDFKVEDESKPLWFYCKNKATVNHCGKGMVFGINAKDTAQMQTFIDEAVKQNGTQEDIAAVGRGSGLKATPITGNVGGYINQAMGQ